MSGAVALAAKAALASGCGLCTAAIPSAILPTFAASVLEATSHPLPCDESGKLIERAADELPALWKNVEVVALGPGLGRSDESFEFVRRVVRECDAPLLVDADALARFAFNRRRNQSANCAHDSHAASRRNGRIDGNFGARSQRIAL
jgi:NAD(P)H-hydrate epimerase